MTDDRDAAVTAWAADLADALEVPREVVDVDVLLALAGRAAHGVVRPAAPLTTFLVGYAAGQRAATEVGSELAVVNRLLAERLPDNGGSTPVPE
jgi:hypothetical protein